jgi:uncharacterized protein with NRDE domain
MCLIVLDWQPRQDNWLTLCANRDEYLKRPTLSMAPWEDFPDIVGGRDLEQGGSWLAVSKGLRFAMVTNIRLGQPPQGMKSRGNLVKQLLTTDAPLVSVMHQLYTTATEYSPFNLLAGDRQQLWYLRNHPEPELRLVPAGPHVLSNAHLDSPWPKAELALNQLSQWQEHRKRHQQPEIPLEQLLNRKEVFPDDQLPETGVPKDWERLLSAQHILTANYGTRCSTSLIATGQQITLTEQSWLADGQPEKKVTYQLPIESRG